MNISYVFLCQRFVQEIKIGIYFFLFLRYTIQKHLRQNSFVFSYIRQKNVFYTETVQKIVSSSNNIQYILTRSIRCIGVEVYITYRILYLFCTNFVRNAQLVIEIERPNIVYIGYIIQCLPVPPETEIKLQSIILINKKIA